eukprot:gene30183-36461_t
MFVFLGRIINQLVQGYIKPVRVVKNRAGLISWDTPFRCLPIDMDIFMHMNNAMYLRVAELARWRIFPKALASSKKSGLGVLFLVVESKVQYMRPINAFQSFVINTALSSSDDKWLHYKHVLQAAPTTESQDPEVFAVVHCRAVLKEKSGKTFRISDLKQDSQFYNMLLENDNIAPKDAV